ncbi:MAG TPA: T9SS type A sorting domain-containing protein, partial [Puia sp.]|nr:T9SS type A sorting domain-containing protein [Puia sp.]
ETNSIDFGRSAASSFSVVSDSAILAIVGAGATGNVGVATAYGSDSLAGFTFIAKTPTDTFKLIQFTGTPVNNQVALQWQTINDRSISDYIIQYSSDSFHFSPRDSLKSAALDSGKNSYQFFDLIPQKGNNYYRLEINDTAQNISFSNIVVVQMNQNPEHLSAYPNPATSHILVQHPISSRQAQLQLVDMKGKLVISINVNPNNAQTTIDLSQVSQGEYILVWRDGTNSYKHGVLVK